MHEPQEAQHVDEWRRDYQSATGDRADLAAFGPVWPLAYLAVASPARAAAEAHALSRLSPDAPHVALVDGTDGHPRFTIAVVERSLSLGELLPPLQSLGLEVLTEQPFQLTRLDGVD